MPPPQFERLLSFYKSLVQNRIDYGSIVYGASSKTSIERVNVASRSILYVILGSRPSTPIEVFYSETGTTPVKQWRQLKATRFLLKLSKLPSNSTCSSVYYIFNNVESWPTYSKPRVSFCVSCQVSDLCKFKNLGMDSFLSDPTPLVNKVLARLLIHRSVIPSGSPWLKVKQCLIEPLFVNVS